MARFYGHFAAAYGTFWFVLMLYAVLSRSHVNAGNFGLFGFPVIAVLYALIRCSAPTQEALEIAELRGRLRQLEQQVANQDRGWREQR